MYSFYARGYQLHTALPKDWDKDDPKEMAFVADKTLSIRTHKAYMLSRLMQMFEYKNLPETIPAEMLELQLLINGVSFITKVDGKLYALEGCPGGEPDPYYRPTKYVWANPALKTSREDDLWTDGVLFRNDKLWLGLSPLMDKYAATLAENEITMRVADIMLRIVAMITTPDDTTKVAAEEYLKKILRGKLGAAAENRFFDGIRMQSPPSNNGSYLTQFIELHQYMKASFFNEVGMQANYNMKRENIGSGETAMNQNATLPLCDQMLEVRKEDVSRLNEMYGTNISVDFTSSWRLNHEQLKLEIEQLKAELEAAKSSQLTGGIPNENNSTDGDDGDGENSLSSDDAKQEDGEERTDESGEVQDNDSGQSGSSEVVDEKDSKEDNLEDSDDASEADPEDGDEASEDSGSSQLTVNVTVNVEGDAEVNVEGGEEDADVGLQEGDSGVAESVSDD